ncbi:unnamed protein product [Didymodactylos carnosus]|uniref:ER-bound oxygenase mpaB/mpaB'/Rubber oxygenase catalytic domain-containing protein n=1 Tax=Didymodactylos carnosus TaxID=1234261 RepID=A0A814R368_9BILA|nr:unnamed protein product [Didymodactylos carnosus]CAF1251434.1 unnamed protein product [Didymodactylos carnosus]CAF3891199.1 unnamed protein product [Didymodactylos carnosus]CAF4058682.1 unnamed protein product [Didymodactylos carnosus]
MLCPYSISDRENNVFILSTKPRIRSDPSVGSQILIYGQAFTWTDKHIPPSQLNEWRKEGDTIVDEFFDIWGQQVQDGMDIYHFVQNIDNLEEHTHICDEDDGHQCICNFDRFVRHTTPEWLNKRQIQQGQKVFLKHTSPALLSIFHYTLILGYGFPQLNDVLTKTQYLLSTPLSLTHRRLIETLQMIMSVVCGDIDDFDQTWADVIRVRLLHGMVRYKINKNRKTSSSGDVPINQEDLLVTLLGFTYSMLNCIEKRMNIHLSMEEKESYLHLWRYIGWLIGIEEKYLYYVSSYNLATIISESIFYHHYFPTELSKHMVHHSLMAVYLHGLIPVSYQFHIGLCQTLLGKELSQALNIHQPNVDRLHLYSIALLLKILKLISWLGTIDFPFLSNLIINRNRQRLKKVIYSSLNNQLHSFALYNKNDPSIAKKVCLKDCCCGYYTKKRTGTVKTHDIGLIRLTAPFTIRHVLEELWSLQCVLFIVRWLYKTIKRNIFKLILLAVISYFSILNCFK